MKHLFVPYELALLAKDKGFDNPCMAYYNDDKELCIKRGNSLSGIINQDCHRLNILAPLYCQLVDWAYNKDGVILQYRPDDEDKMNKEILQWLESTK